MDISDKNLMDYVLIFPIHPEYALCLVKKDSFLYGEPFCVSSDFVYMVNRYLMAKNICICDTSGCVVGRLSDEDFVRKVFEKGNL